MSSTDVAAIVLAAGSSTRLGRPKQLAEVGGRTLVRAAVEEAATACAHVAVVVGEEAVARPIALALADLDVAVLPNESHAEGMASSIRTGVAWAAEKGFDGVLLLACDQPDLRAHHLLRLLNVGRAAGRPVGSTYSGALGVPAYFPQALFAALLALAGAHGARRLLATTAALAVEWPEGAFDVDTPEDLARFETSSVPAAR